MENGDLPLIESGSAFLFLAVSCFSYDVRHRRFVRIVVALPSLVSQLRPFFVQGWVRPTTIEERKQRADVSYPTSSTCMFVGPLFASDFHRVVFVCDT